MDIRSAARYAPPTWRRGQQCVPSPWRGGNASAGRGALRPSQRRQVCVCDGDTTTTLRLVRRPEHSFELVHVTNIVVALYLCVAAA